MCTTCETRALSKRQALSGGFNLENLFPMSAGDLGKMKRPSQFVSVFRLLALHQAQPSVGAGRPRVRGLPLHVLPRSVGLGLPSLRCRWLVLPVVGSPGHRRPEASCLGLSGLGSAVAGPPPNTLNAGRRRAGSGGFRLRQCLNSCELAVLPEKTNLLSRLPGTGRAGSSTWRVGGVSKWLSHLVIGYMSYINT